MAAIALKDKPLYRYFRVEPKDFADDDTVQVAFSSEFPGKQRADEEEEGLGIAKKGEIYTEILSHDPADVDFSQLTSGRAAFLDEHKDFRHIGNVKTAALSKDKVGRAVLKFDRATKLSKTRQKQMRSGSRPNVSYGYTHTAYIGTRNLEDGTIGHVFAHRGHEVSNVANPMDPSVGLNRSADQEKSHCLGCGNEFDRESLDDEYFCKDCADAIDDGTTERVHPGGHVRVSNLTIPDTAMKFRSSDNKEISLNDLRLMVQTEVGEDSRFNKQENGEKGYSYTSDFLTDGTDWKAIIQAANGKYYEVPFTVKADKATLGAETEVATETKYKPVERSIEHTVKPPSVDLQKFVTELTPDQKMNMKTILLAPDAAAGGGVATLDEPKIRADEAKKTREAVQTETGAAQEKVKARNTEIKALADEGVKQYGERWGGEPGKVFVV